MKQPLFIETIKIKDGKFYNLSLHEQRLQDTTLRFFGIRLHLPLPDEIIPEHLRDGLVKCRILYSNKIESVEFTPYSFRNISRLTLVESDDIDYVYKSMDRSLLMDLYSRKQDGDDILIIKNGLVTDTSYANVVFQDSGGLFTPQSFLLNGIKRQLLLQQHHIEVRNIRAEDIPLYHTMYLINAMIDIENGVCVSTSAIK